VFQITTTGYIGIFFTAAEAQCSNSDGCLHYAMLAHVYSNHCSPTLAFRMIMHDLPGPSQILHGYTRV